MFLFHPSPCCHPAPVLTPHPLPTGHQKWAEALHSRHQHKGFDLPNISPTQPQRQPSHSPHQREYLSLFSPV